MRYSKYISNTSNIQNEINSLRERIQNTKDSIDIIENQLSEFVSQTDIPTQKYKDLRSLKKKLHELESELDSKLDTKKIFVKQQPGVPKLLPYSPNRREQIVVLKQKISDLQNKKKPLLCIIHGNQSQCHDIFVDKIRRDILEKEYNYITQRYIIHCPKYSINNQDDFNKQLIRNLTNEIQKTKKFSDNIIKNQTAYINSNLSAEPTIIHLNLSLSKWNKKNIRIMRFLINFWQQCNFINHSQFLMICLSVQYVTEDTLCFLEKIYLKFMKEKRKKKKEN